MNLAAIRRRTAAHSAVAILFLCGCGNGIISRSSPSPGPVYNFGDSITAGCYAQGNCPSSAGFAYLLCAHQGWTCRNDGVSRTQLMDAAINDTVLNANISQNTISTFLVGANDMRSSYCTGCTGGMSTVAAQQQFYGQLESSVTWAALPAAAKTTAQTCYFTPNSPTCSFTENWVAAGADGTMLTTQAGASVTVHLAGTAIYFASIEQFDNDSTYTLTIDGAPFPGRQSTLTTAGVIARTINDPSRNYSQYLYRAGGLDENQHTIVFTCVSVDYQDPCYFAWAGSNSTSPFTNEGPSLQRPWVLLGNTLRATPAGYATFGGSDTIVAQFDAMARQAAQELQSDRLNVQLVDTSAAMNPDDSSLYYADGFHPGTTGHQVLAGVYESAIDARSFPSIQADLRLLVR